MDIILASGSPRRKHMLEHMGLQFRVVPSDYVEQHNESRPVTEVAEQLALGKALDVAQKYPDAIVIGGDSIVSFEGKQLGKPKSEQEARATLEGYSEQTCQTTSGVAVVCHAKQFQKVLSDSTTIRFGEISTSVIDEYIATGNYTDKAGSFAIQHPIIRQVTKEIDGNIDTVVGLPTKQLHDILQQLGIASAPLQLNVSEMISL